MGGDDVRRGEGRRDVMRWICKRNTHRRREPYHVVSQSFYVYVLLEGGWDRVRIQLRVPAPERMPSEVCLRDSPWRASVHVVFKHTRWRSTHEALITLHNVGASRMLQIVKLFNSINNSIIGNFEMYEFGFHVNKRVCVCVCVNVDIPRPPDTHTHTHTVEFPVKIQN